MSNMKISEFIKYFKQQFPLIGSVYNGTINKKEQQCIGIYSKGDVPAIISLGGIEHTTLGTLAASILIHWTENADTCETVANSIYENLIVANKIIIDTRKIIMFSMQNAGPVNIARDENNICEMVIRVHIIYER